MGSLREILGVFVNVVTWIQIRKQKDVLRMRLTRDTKVLRLQNSNHKNVNINNAFKMSDPLKLPP